MNSLEHTMKATIQRHNTKKTVCYTLAGFLLTSVSFAPLTSFAQTAISSNAQTQSADTFSSSSSLPEQSTILQNDPSLEGEQSPNTYYGAGYSPNELGVQKTGPYLGTTQDQQSFGKTTSAAQKNKQRTSYRFDFKPYVQQTFTYSDNIGLDPEGFEDDGFVSSSTIGVDVNANTRRLRTTAGVSATYDHYFTGDDQDDGFRPYGYLNSSLEAVDNFFYIDAFGTISTRTLDENDRFSANPVANSNDQVIVYTGSISPAIRKNIGGYANTELRYTHSRTGYSDDDIDQDGQFSNTFSAAVQSDPRKFRTFGWNTRVEHEIYENIGEGGDQVRTSLSGGVEVPLSTRTTVFTNVGHDWFDPDLAFDGSDASGVFGNVGVRFNPNQRFSSEAYVGFRYGGFDYGASASYYLTKRLQLIGSARRSIQTGSIDNAPFGYDSAFVQDGNGRNVPVYRRDDYRSNPTPALNNNNFSDFYTSNFNEAFLVNQLDGSTGTLNDSGFGIVDSSTLRDTLSVTLLGSTPGGLRYTLSGTALNRQFSSNQGDEFILGGNAGVEKDITNRLTLGSNLSYTRFNGDDPLDVDTDTMALSLSANYLLTPAVSTFAEYTYSQRFADEDLSEYNENAASVGVRASF